MTGDIVYTDTLTVKYSIRDRGGNWEYRYDWVTTGGNESDTFFKKIEEAVTDVEAYHQ